ncbi:MAG: GGDEF domain-containing protein [Terracidiphilus sp.]|jgi:diguanylate cyclase (GGDEF)-like protein
MKRLGFAAVVLVAAVHATAASAPAPLTSLHLLTALTNDQSSQRQPVSFDATVTYYRSYDKDLFVQDGSDAIYVHAPTTLHLVPGDRIRIHGTMHESFRPYVDSQDIKRIGQAPLPKPLQPSFDQMIRAEIDCKYVTVRALVRTADLVPNPRSPKLTTRLHMIVDGGQVDANVDSDDENALRDLLDAEVQITGAIAGQFDNKMQMTGLLLHVQSMDGIEILKRAPSDPWSLPATSMDRVVAGLRSVDLTKRTHVVGTVTYYQPGAALVLQNGQKSLWITTSSWVPLRVGEQADVIGFPAVENGFLTLTRAEIHDSGAQAQVAPSLLTWRDLAVGGNDGHSRIFDLVSVEGRVVTEVRQATQDEYVIESDGHLFSAILRHPGPTQSATLSPMLEIPIDSRVRVTGICMLSGANPFNGEVPFNILMRDAGDMVIVAQSPWLNVSHLLLIVGLMLVVVIALGVRGWYLERRNRRKIGSLAYLERRRSRILEDINHSKPLAEILERITELVSVRLNGIPCWCQVADGPMLGNRPAQLNSPSLRTAAQPIPSRSGSALGIIYAAFDAHSESTAEHKAALAMAAELATLAIETSRLYSDLVHRSEFDLLTDVQNRFSMERALCAQIQAARQSAGIFGLIYVDLDDFKQVNDLHGHHAGDLYLREVVRRMKRQLRPGDVLARLGGDEFAVVVSEVHNREDVELVAARLRECFEHPFEGGGFRLRGSASLGIALYPEDASSADSLLRAADAAMYAVKYSRPGRRPVGEALPDGELTPRDL